MHSSLQMSRVHFHVNAGSTDQGSPRVHAGLWKTRKKTAWKPSATCQEADQVRFSIPSESHRHPGPSRTYHTFLVLPVTAVAGVSRLEVRLRSGRHFEYFAENVHSRSSSENFRAVEGCEGSPLPVRLGDKGLGEQNWYTGQSFRKCARGERGLAHHYWRWPTSSTRAVSC